MLSMRIGRPRRLHLQQRGSKAISGGASRGVECVGDVIPADNPVVQKEFCLFPVLPPGAPDGAHNA
jgi:hypothetical protein